MSGIVNVTTGKIYGVKKGTRAYYHEEGHLVWANSENGTRNAMYQKFTFDLIFPFLIGAVWFPKLAFVAAGLYVMYQAFDIIEEKWCWKYADRRMNEQTNKS